MKRLEEFDSISMIDFVTNYLDMEELLNDKVINLLSKATHKDIKELNFPYVKAVPFDIVTKDDVMEGRIILVHDGKSRGKNRRIAPYIRPELLKEEELMEYESKRELLFRKEKGKENFKLVFDVRNARPETLEISFEEAALIVTYPDGGIDVVPFDHKHEWHAEYYKLLISSSKRFASIAREIIFRINFFEEYNTILLNRELSACGISAMHNLSVHDMLEDREFLKRSKAYFFMFLAGNESGEQKNITQLIEENYDLGSYTKNVYNSQLSDFEDVKKRGREL